jgi:hypothetical protein
MLRQLVCAAAALVLCAGGLLAGEYKGKVKSVDAAKSTITVTVNDKDMTFKVTDDTKIVRGKKDVAKRLAAKVFQQEGAEVTVLTTGEGSKEVATEIKVKGKKKNQ